MNQTATMDGMARNKGIFSEKLKRAIASSGRTQQDLARVIGITPNMFTKYFGGALPNASIAFKIAQALNVDLYWLCDESETNTDPTSATHRIKDISDSDLHVEMQRRYIAAARPLSAGLETSDSPGWEHAAAWLLYNQDRPKVIIPEPVAEMVRRAKAIDYCRYRVELYSAAFAFYDVVLDPDDRGDGFVPGRGDANGAIKPGVLHERMKSFEQAHPGYRAMVEYMRYSAYDWPDGKRRERRSSPMHDEQDIYAFWWMRARYWLARIVTHEHCSNDAKYDPIRKMLKEGDFLTKRGKPTDKGDAPIPDLVWQLQASGAIDGFGFKSPKAKGKGIYDMILSDDFVDELADDDDDAMDDQAKE